MPSPLNPSSPEDGEPNSPVSEPSNSFAPALEPASEPGGEVRVLRPRRAAPADAVRPTRAEVNLMSLRHNLRALERALEPESGHARPAIWGVLKADGYGHGAAAVARTLERAGVPSLCVALLEEAVELRAAGIRIPILVMGGYYGPGRGGFEEILAHDLVPVVYDAAHVERLAAIARADRRGPVGVHLKVDTGMARLGVNSRELDAVLRAIVDHREVRLDGFMTHLACADEENLDATREQLRQFEQAEQMARRMGLSPRIRHVANSAAMLRLPSARFEVVRPGIALFGVAPPRCVDADGKLAANSDAKLELRPVMRVRSELVALRTVNSGESIGYGYTWKARRTSQIATVPMGYADGLCRQLSNRGHALVRGRRAPIVGAISMDLTMLDVTDIPGARVADEAVFLGGQEGPLGKDSISAGEIADHTGTIAWEVLTSISRRVPRFYREP